LKGYCREEAAAAVDGVCWFVCVVSIKLRRKSSDSG